MELESDVVEKQMAVALPRGVWRQLEEMEPQMEDPDLGGVAECYGHMLAHGMLRFRSCSRRAVSPLHSWHLFLREGASYALVDIAASHYVWRDPDAWRRFFRFAWMMWWRYQIVNGVVLSLGGAAGALAFNVGWPVLMILIVPLFTVGSVFAQGLTVSRAFNVYVEHHNSLPVLFGRPYG